MKTVSIIIPVFNAEKFIHNCLQSCLKQNISEDSYEIIVINDGSTDRSAEIIKEFKNKFSNIVFIQQQNQGVSAARNRGLEIATGNYILFVDSDDTIEENSLQSVFYKAKNNDHEIIILNSLIRNDGKKYREVYKFPEQFSGKTIPGTELFMKGYIRGSVCGVAFKRDFLYDNHIKFPETIKNGEDSLFMTLCFMYAQTVIHLDLDFYKVTIRKDSASRRWSIYKINELLDSMNVISEYISTHRLSPVQLAMLNIRTYRIISSAIYHFFSLHQLSRYFELRNKIIKNDLYPVKKHGAQQFKLQICILNFSIDLFCLLFFARQVFIDIRKLINC